MTTTAATEPFADHDLAGGTEFTHIRYERRPLRHADGSAAVAFVGSAVAMDAT